MSDLNKVQLIGRLGADPEVRQFANGGSVGINLAIDSKAEEAKQ